MRLFEEDTAQVNIYVKVFEAELPIWIFLSEILEIWRFQNMFEFEKNYVALR